MSDGWLGYIFEVFCSQMFHQLHKERKNSTKLFSEQLYSGIHYLQDNFYLNFEVPVRCYCPLRDN